AQFLRLRQRGDDLLMLDQRGAHVGEHRLAMLGGAVELAMNLAVTHVGIPYLRRDGSSDICSGGLPAFALVVIPGRTIVRTRNLEIPGSMLSHRPGMTNAQ